MIMYSDQATAPSEVDCSFGPNTAQRTREWQTLMNNEHEGHLAITGKLDQATRDFAGTRIIWDTDAGDGSTYVWFIGYRNAVYIHRLGASARYRYDVRSIFGYGDLPDGDWHAAAYSYANFRTCSGWR
jgi:hypothetical protein